jgi:hypothetical protein
VPPKLRPILTSDLWSAARGLSMGQRSDEELRDLIKRHEHNAKTVFAAAVICEAADQILATRRIRMGLQP